MTTFIEIFYKNQSFKFPAARSRDWFLRQLLESPYRRTIEISAIRGPTIKVHGMKREGQTAALTQQHFYARKKSCKTEYGILLLRNIISALKGQCSFLTPSPSKGS